MSKEIGRRLQELRRSGASGKHKDSRPERKDRQTRERLAIEQDLED